MRSLKFLILAALVVSCTSNTIYKKPKNFITPEKMVDILTDIYLANSAYNSPNKVGGTNMQYMSLVYKKYHIDSVTYKENTKYYLSRIKEYKSINQKVINRLELMEKKSRIVADRYDSLTKLKLDSLKKVLKKENFPDELTKENKLNSKLII